MLQLRTQSIYRLRMFREIALDMAVQKIARVLIYVRKRQRIDMMIAYLYTRTYPAGSIGDVSRWVLTILSDCLQMSLLGDTRFIHASLSVNFRLARLQSLASTFL